MACILDNGYVLPCASVGGAELVYLGTFSSDADYTLDVNNVITGFTSGSTIYKFEQSVETAGVTQNIMNAPENGTSYMESKLTMKFSGLDAELRNTILSLAKAPLVAVVKANSGEYFYLGAENAGYTTTGTASIGVAMGDRNGAELEITFKSQNGMFLIDSSLIGTDLPVGV